MIHNEQQLHNINEKQMVSVKDHRLVKKLKLIMIQVLMIVVLVYQNLRGLRLVLKKEEVTEVEKVNGVPISSVKNHLIKNINLHFLLIIKYKKYIKINI